MLDALLVGYSDVWIMLFLAKKHFTYSEINFNPDDCDKIYKGERRKLLSF